MKSWFPHGLICLALAGLTFLCMGRVVANDFINLDDPTYVYQNPPVIDGLSWPGVQWAFTTSHAAFWIPLTWLSLQFDATLYWSGPPGLASASAAAWGFHLTNLLLHVANTLLAYGIVFRLTGRIGIAVCVAALFGIHPLHVESVAWITERKDVLSAFFGLLALLAYLRYQEKPSVARMTAVGILFALSLMAKPVTVILPGVMLLLDWWRRGLSGVESWGWAIVEKLPLIGLSFLCTVVTVYTQRADRGVANLSDLSLYERGANAAVSYEKYLARTFWPMDLGVFYPHPGMYPQPDEPLSLWKVILALAILTGITALAILLRRTLPAVLVGWLWFLGALLPNIGLLQAGNQAMADRFCYFALLGLFLALVLAGDRLVTLIGLGDAVKIAIFTPLVVSFGALTWVQVGYWQNSQSLYEHTLAVTQGNPYIHGFLGFDLYERGDWDSAEEHLRKYVTSPRNGLVAFQYRYGDVLLQRYFKSNRADSDMLKKAAAHLSYTIKKDPDFAAARFKFASALIEIIQCDRTGEIPPEERATLLDSAANHLRHGLQLQPETAGGYLSLAWVLAARGEFANARQTLQMGIERTNDPGNLQQMNNLLKALPEVAP